MKLSDYGYRLALDPVHSYSSYDTGELEVVCQGNQKFGEQTVCQGNQKFGEQTVCQGSRKFEEQTATYNGSRKATVNFGYKGCWNKLANLKENLHEIKPIYSSS